MDPRPWLPDLTGPPRRLVEALRLGGPATRAQLVEQTGLSRATVSGYVSDLVGRGLVSPADAQPTGGRPAGLVRLTRRAGVVVGVDVGRTHVRVAVADLSHEVVGEHVVSLAVADLAADAALDAVAARVCAELERVGATSADVAGMVVGLPTPLVGGAATAEATVAQSNILPTWSGSAPALELRRRLAVPVIADNDANLGALAEVRWGAGRGSRFTVYLKMATGVGGALVLDGHLLRGVGGTAGEIGHVSLDPAGALCRCGNRGCLELTAGGGALLDAIRTAAPQYGDLRSLVAGAVDGDQACRRLVADAGTSVGLVLGGLVNTLNPDRIVVGGELGAAGDLLVDPLRRALVQSAIPAAAERLAVVPGSLGGRAEALGALAVALREADRLA
ncbi:Sugar kinase of the NBD/HSP70 family, may contain an N-terminal HTH domain [Geodermatophilus dictyosporus]|uniref:Sugar kinase of the NBD/HSP70 family, may contain an N-terminal HTH domain n=1 Tax=Geodermatophilus dictyosporus TaxID=1523247 RepID=A0A1I5QWB4_9ACTN|nr:ROK family transcriptional regulator [Geodermatophilus dictyosporus]SFP50569.1 Sugar kinase of the NBD/HSP70 family, may contain an N-terminal HTH domain [Geodermatophilus dictyosporus]